MVGAGDGYDAVIGACRKAGFDPVIVQMAPQIASVITLVAAEVSVAMAPASTSQLHIAGIAYRAIAGEAPITRLGLAYRRGETSPIVRNFIAFFAPSTVVFPISTYFVAREERVHGWAGAGI
jgi:DNA-binding transcriptional LysR family regulator